MALKDYDAAIERQSDRPFEPRERQQLRYIVLERFWADARFNARMKRALWLLLSGVGAACTLIQTWEPMEKLWASLFRGTIH